MVNKLSFLAATIFLCFSFNTFAIEKLSCVELEATANDLDDVADGFYAASNIIRENDPLDRALRDVVNALHIIAASEGEVDLSAYVQGMETAWNNMDSNHFTVSLDGVIDSLDRLLERDCY